MGMESVLGGLEIGQADLEGVMSLTQRVLDMVSDSWRQIGPLEQGQHLLTTAQQ